MALQYVIATQAQLRTLDFSLVKEDSWNTCRWSNDTSEAYIHWESTTETATLTAWLITNRLDRSIKTKADANTGTRTTQKGSWDLQPRPPRE